MKVGETMIKFIKRNKVLSILIFLSILTIIIGFFLPALLPSHSREVFVHHLVQLNPKTMNDSLFFETIFFTLIIWFLGISIIGIPIVFFLYLSKLFIVIVEISFILHNFQKVNLFTVIQYCIPRFVNLPIFFFLTLYSMDYSLFLIKILFFKKELPKYDITRKYLKILLFSILFFLIKAIIEKYLIPKFF